MEARHLLSTFDISGVQPAALDQPQIHALFRTTANGVPLSASDGLGGTSFDVQAFLDTGTSGTLLSQETAQGLGIASSTFGGTPVNYVDVGVGGAEYFDVSQPIYTALAPFIPTADVDNLATYSTVYNQTYGPVRTEIAQAPADPLVGPLDILGMPLLQGKVMVMDPRPVALVDNMHTFVYNPGVPFNAAAQDTNPGIPTTDRHVRLSYANFTRFTQVTPSGAAGPNLAANPFIGPDPTRSLSASPPPDATPPVQLAQGTHTSTGSFLFDTGAGASFISTAEAANLHVHYKAGTYNTDAPILVDDNGVNIPNQFVIPLGGIGGTLNAAGFYVDSLTLPTTEGPGIRFLKAPVLVADISVQDPLTKQSLTLDGDFGMNFLVASADISGGIPTNVTDGAFDWVVFDQPSALLGLQIPSAPSIFNVAFSAGSNAVYVKRDADQTHADFWINSATPGQGAPAQQTLIAQNQSFAMSGGSGNDTLTLDFSNGNPLPAGGLTFDGGLGTNTLAVIGTSGDDTLAATSAGLTFSGGTFANVPISAANLQALQFHGGSGGNDAVNVTSGTYALDADTPAGTPNVSVTVGAAATVTFGSSQHLANLTVNDGTARVAAPARYAISLAGLTIAGNGLLDIGNSFLYLPSDAARTSFGKVQGYWVNGYNRSNPANLYYGTGFGDWNGRGGISSSAAIASYASNVQVTLGVFDGQFAVANGIGMGPGAVEDFSFSGGQALSPNLPQNQLLVRPTLTTDVNGDGKTDAYDVLLINTFYRFYGPGRPGGVTNLGVMVGDLNGDGAVDATDVLIYNTAYAGPAVTYNLALAPPAPTAVTASATVTAKSAGSAVPRLNDPAPALKSVHARPRPDRHPPHGGAWFARPHPRRR